MQYHIEIKLDFRLGLGNFYKCLGILAVSREGAIERKCPYIRKLKGEGNFPLYFDNDECQILVLILAKKK